MTQETPLFDATKVGKEISGPDEKGRLAAANSILDLGSQANFAKVKDQLNANIDFKKLGLEGFHIDDERPVRIIKDADNTKLPAIVFTDGSGNQRILSSDGTELYPSADGKLNPMPVKQPDVTETSAPTQTPTPPEKTATEAIDKVTSAPPEQPAAPAEQSASPSSDRDKVSKFVQQQVDAASKSLPVGNGEGYFQVLQRMEAQGLIPAVDDGELSKRAVFLRDTVNQRQVLIHGDTFDTMSADEKAVAFTSQMAAFDKMSDADKAKIIAEAKAAFPDAPLTPAGDSTGKVAGGSADGASAGAVDGFNKRDANQRITTNDSGYIFGYDAQGELNSITTIEGSAGIDTFKKDASGWRDDQNPPQKFKTDPALDQRTGDLSFQRTGQLAIVCKADGSVIQKNDDGTVSDVLDKQGNERKYTYANSRLSQVDYLPVGSTAADPANSWTLKGDHFENGEKPPKSVKSINVDATSGDFIQSDKTTTPAKPADGPVATGQTQETPPPTSTKPAPPLEPMVDPGSSILKAKLVDNDPSKTVFNPLAPAGLGEGIPEQNLSETDGIVSRLVRRSQDGNSAETTGSLDNGSFFSWDWWDTEFKTEDTYRQGKLNTRTTTYDDGNDVSMNFASNDASKPVHIDSVVKVASVFDATQAGYQTIVTDKAGKRYTFISDAEGNVTGYTPPDPS